MLLQLRHDHLDQRRGHGEGDADIAATGREDRGVHADDLAIQVEGRTARIAAVHRRVDLQVVVGTRADVAVMGRDDAGCHRAAEAERIADGEHPVTDAGVLVGEVDERKLLAVRLDLDQGHVRTGIGADQRGRELVAVLHRHRDVLGVLDHVIVGDHEAVRRDEETRPLRQRRVGLLGSAAATTATAIGLALAEMLEEIIERAVLGDVGHARDLQIVIGDLSVALDVDADHRRAHLRDDVGEGQRRAAKGGIDRRLRGLGGSERNAVAEREP